MAKALYLVQHGESASEEADPARPLTERGRGDVERVARAAAHLDLALARILHSGKLRARQTAEILAARLAPREGVFEVAGLGPKDDPAVAARLVEEPAGPLLLVGHLPHLGKLAGLLLTGDPEKGVIAFRMGGMVALDAEPDAWRVRFALTPDLVRE